MEIEMIRMASIRTILVENPAEAVGFGGPIPNGGGDGPPQNHHQRSCCDSMGPLASGALLRRIPGRQHGKGRD